MDLKNKKVVITGASSGIGLAVLRRLLEEGAVVVAAARHTQNINIKTDNLILCSCDVSVREEVDRLFSFAVSALGTIDIFIANAGFAYYEIIDTPDWVHAQSIFDTNVLSVIYSAEKMKALRARPAVYLPLYRERHELSVHSRLRLVQRHKSRAARLCRCIPSRAEAWTEFSRCLPDCDNGPSSSVELAAAR